MVGASRYAKILDWITLILSKFEYLCFSIKENKFVMIILEMLGSKN